MTWEELVKDHLTKNGMFPEHVNEVFEMMKEDEIKELRDRWKDDISGYPPTMKNVVIFITNRTALKWIDTNLPKAWFRSMFEKRSVK